MANTAAAQSDPSSADSHASDSSLPGATQPSLPSPTTPGATAPGAIVPRAGARDPLGLDHTDPGPTAPPSSAPSNPNADVESAPTAGANAQVASLPTRAVRRLTLEQCQRMAVDRYPSIAEARARISQAEAQLWLARTVAFSDFETTAGIALAPTVRGTQTFSPSTDVSISSNMGLAWQVNASGTVPIWTFGKIDAAAQAARAGVQVKEHEAEKVRNELKQTVRQAYFGVQFARDALSLLQEAEQRLDKYLPSVQAAVDNDDADEVPLFKMKMYRAELAARHSEAERQEKVALSGLRYLIGEGSGSDVLDEPMPEPKNSLAPLARYLTAARLYRPEINMAHAGVLAREAQLRLERAKAFPDLGVTLSVGWSQAPEVTDQLNPFVRDPGNFLHYGFAFGLKWKLDFLPQAAKRADAQAKLDEVRATEQFALGGVGVEVEKAYLEAVDAERRLQAYGESAEWARRWMITVQQGIDVGTYKDEDIVQPAKEYALRRFTEMNAAYEYNVALGRLALATGWDAALTGATE
ncbi:MAG TPA: TolC family protein [Polyangiaceae bacterium]|nr:TolC family protein [Polyangiaceae bacterium]